MIASQRDHMMGQMLINYELKVECEWKLELRDMKQCEWKESEESNVPQYSATSSF